MKVSATDTPITTIVSEHLEEAAWLCSQRAYLVSVPHVNLKYLGRQDERLDAHLDGVAVSGDFGTQQMITALESPKRGSIFVATVRSIDNSDFGLVRRLFALAKSLPEAEAELISAFGWVSGKTLKGIAGELLNHADPFCKCVALAAYAKHRVDPGDRKSVV